LAKDAVRKKQTVCLLNPQRRHHASRRPPGGPPSEVGPPPQKSLPRPGPRFDWAWFLVSWRCLPVSCWMLVLGWGWGPRTGAPRPMWNSRHVPIERKHSSERRERPGYIAYWLRRARLLLQAASWSLGCSSL
jgi:hypothetical protein